MIFEWPSPGLAPTQEGRALGTVIVWPAFGTGGAPAPTVFGPVLRTAGQSTATGRSAGQSTATGRTAGQSY